MTPASGFSAPSPKAGSMSVPRSTARICRIVSASGMPKKAYARYGTSSGTFDVRM